MSYAIVEHRDAGPRDVVVSWHRTYSAARKAAQRMSAGGRSPVAVEAVSRRYRAGEAIDVTAEREAARLQRSSAAALLGARGGAAGSGKAKRRATSFDGASGAAAGSAGSGKAKRRGGPEHYRQLAAKSAAARRAKKDSAIP